MADTIYHFTDEQKERMTKQDEFDKVLAKLKEMSSNQLIDYALVNFDVMLSNAYGRDWLQKMVAYKAAEKIIGLTERAKKNLCKITSKKYLEKVEREAKMAQAKNETKKKATKSTREKTYKDSIAKELDGMELSALYAGMSKIGFKDLKSKYAKLNLGMQRMNLGNRIRKLCAAANISKFSTLVKKGPAVAATKIKVTKAAPKRAKAKRAGNKVAGMTPKGA